MSTFPTIRKTVPPDPTRSQDFSHRPSFHVSYNIRRSTTRLNESHVNSHPIRAPKLTTMPQDVLHLIIDELDAASTITLVLTCKIIANTVCESPYHATQATRLHDRPTFIKVSTIATSTIPPHVLIVPFTYYTSTFSDRRILMLQLESWMRKGCRLCWICLKYTSVASGGLWNSTTQVNTMGNNHIPVDCLMRKPLKKVWAHSACMTANGLTHGRYLGTTCRAVAGAAGGEDMYVPSVQEQDGMRSSIVYQNGRYHGRVRVPM